MKNKIPSIKNLKYLLIAALSLVAALSVYHLITRFGEPNRPDISTPTNVPVGADTINIRINPNNTVNLEKDPQNLKLNRKFAVATHPETRQPYLAGIQADKTIIVWEAIITDDIPKKLSLNTAKILNDTIQDNEEIGAIAISADCQYLAASFTVKVEKARTDKDGKNNRIVIWDLSTGKVLTRLYGPIDSDKKFNYFNYSLIFSPDNQYLISSHRKQTNSKVIVWKFPQMLPKNTGKIREIKLQDLTKNTNYYQIDADRGPLQSIALSSDGKLLATSGSEKNIKLWNAETWENQAIVTAFDLKSSFNGAQTLSFRRDNKRLVAGTATPLGNKGEVYIWDVENLNDPQLIREFNDTFNSSVVSTDFGDESDYLLAVSLEGEIKIWNNNLDQDTISTNVNFEKMDSAFFIPNNRQSFLMIADDGNITMWTVPPIPLIVSPTSISPPQPPEPPRDIDKTKLLSGLLLLLYSPIALYFLSRYRNQLKDLILFQKSGHSTVRDNLVNQEIDRIVDREINGIATDLKKQEDQKVYIEYKDQSAKERTALIEIEYDTQKIVENLRQFNIKLREKVQSILQHNLVFHPSDCDPHTLTQLRRLTLGLIVSHIVLFFVGILLLFTVFQEISQRTNRSNLSYNYPEEKNFGENFVSFNDGYNKIEN